MRSRWIAWLFVAAAVVSAAGCDRNPKAALPVVTTTTTVPVTAPTVPTLHFGSPEEAIRHVILQWQANDREAAGQAATAEAVTQLFSKPAKAVQFRNCSSSGANNLGSDCIYRYDDGLLRLHLVKTGDDWKITMAAYEGVP